MKSVLIIGLLSFIAGVGCTLLGLALLALIGFQDEPAFIAYPDVGATGAAGAPEMVLPTIPTTTTITPVQQEAIQQAYEAIDKADKAFEYRRDEYAD
jgi:hypothetical protein